MNFTFNKNEYANSIKCDYYDIVSLMPDDRYCAFSDKPHRLRTSKTVHVPGDRFNIKMPSYQYTNSHYKINTVSQMPNVPLMPDDR